MNLPSGSDYSAQASRSSLKLDSPKRQTPRSFSSQVQFLQSSKCEFAEEKSSKPGGISPGGGGGGRKSSTKFKIIPKKQALSEEEEFINILKKPYRTPQEITMIEEKTKDLRFFQQINKVAANQKANLHRRICKVMEFEFYPKGRVVFYEGDQADTFYVLLKGKALILLKENIKQNAGLQSQQAIVSRKLIIPGSSQQISSLLMKMLRIRMLHRIVWRLINILRFIKFATKKKKNKSRISIINVRKIKDESPKESKLVGAFGNKSYGHDKFQKLRGDIRTNIHPDLDILYLENVQRFFDKQFQCFQYTASKQIEEGDSFGELGLLNRKPRSATIVCLTDCYFAVLSKQHYSDTLTEVEKQQIQKRVIFLSQILLPSVYTKKQQNTFDLSGKDGGKDENEGNHQDKSEQPKIQPYFENKLNKLQVNFSKCKINAGYFMIKQGKPVDVVYIIKKGEVVCELKQISKDGKQENIHLAILQRGEIIGADELLLDQKASSHHDLHLEEDEEEKNLKNLFTFQASKVVGYCSTIVKSFSCSALCIQSNDFRRILEDFPEMRIHLLKKSQAKRKWMEVRRQEQEKLFTKLNKRSKVSRIKYNSSQGSVLATAVKDEAMTQLLSKTSLLSRTFYNKEKSEYQQQLKLNENNDSQNILAPTHLETQKTRKNAEVEKLVKKYFTNELSQLKNSSSSNAELIEKGLELKYGYLHSLSSHKLSASKVVDFIFNHSENNKQDANVNKQGEQSQKIKRGGGGEENDIITSNQIPESSSPLPKMVKVDYSTLGYSDEVIKRMNKRQSQIISPETKIEIEAFSKYGEKTGASTQQHIPSQVSQNLISQNSFNFSLTNQNSNQDCIRKSHRTSLGNALKVLIPQNQNQQDNKVHKNESQNQVQEYSTIKKFYQQDQFSKTQKNLYQPKQPKRLSISFDPDEMRKNNMLNKQILNETLDMNQSRDAYYIQASNVFANTTANSATPLKYKSFLASHFPSIQNRLQTSPTQTQIPKHIDTHTCKTANSHSPNRKIIVSNPLINHNSIYVPNKQPNIHHLKKSEIQTPTSGQNSLHNSSLNQSKNNSNPTHSPVLSHHLEQTKTKHRSLNKAKTIECETTFNNRVLKSITSGSSEIITEHIIADQQVGKQHFNHGFSHLNSQSSFSKQIDEESQNEFGDSNKQGIDFSSIIQVEQKSPLIEIGHLYLLKDAETSMSNSKLLENNKKLSQFFKGQGESNKTQLNAILSKFQYEPKNNNINSKTIYNHSTSNVFLPNTNSFSINTSKEINIHLKKKKAQCKSVLWQPNKFMNQNQIPKELFQTQCEHIYSKISPCFVQRNTQSSMSSIPTNTNLQPSKQNASTETKIENRKTQEKIVMMNHMGKPRSYVVGLPPRYKDLSPDKSRHSSLPEVVPFQANKTLKENSILGRNVLQKNKI